MSFTQKLDPSTALGGVPTGLRDPLIHAYNSIVKNFRERRWEPAELNGGKLSEIVYTILKGHIDGNYPSVPQKPRRMDEACKALESADPAQFSRSIRVHIPRMLIALYEVRNNRGVGHTGGDVDPNHMDSLFVLNAAKWIMAELVRVFHNVDTVTATNVVEALTDRTIPLIWEVGENKRILDPNLTMKNKTMALLYSSTGAVSETDLFRWVEHSNQTVFRRDILVKAHGDKLIEYDAKNRSVQLSPKGIKYVEENVPFEI